MPLASSRTVPLALEPVLTCWSSDKGPPVDSVMSPVFDVTPGDCAREHT